MSCRGARRFGGNVLFCPIEMKFGMGVEFDELNDFPKFGCDKLISCPVRARTKKFS